MRMLGLAAFALGFAAAGATATAADTQWVMATGLPDSNFLTRNVRMFVAEIEEGSHGRLKIDAHTDSTLVKRAAIKRAVQSGQVHMGELDFPAYGNEDPMYVLDAIPGLAPDVEACTLLWDLQKPYFDELLARDGMRILYTGTWPGQGFYTQAPVETAEDFRGKRLRIYSTATQKMGELLGFQATILPFAEVPQAFATGLIEAMYTSAQTGVDIQAWDYTSHFYNAGGCAKAPVVVNDRAFESLDADLQQLVLAAAERAYARSFELLAEASDSQEATLREHGMTVDVLPPEVAEEFQRVGEIMLEEWREAASPEANSILDEYLKARQR